MTGVEHLGQYVFEMSQAKVEAVRKGEGVILMDTDAPGLSGEMSGDEDDDNAVQNVEEVGYDAAFEAEDEIQPLDAEATEKALDEYPQ